MAIVANTFTTFDAIGIAEDVDNVITMISPEETPVLSNADRGEAENTHFEWQTDALASASSANQQLDGDDYTSYSAITPTVRLGNYTEIGRKLFLISNTELAVRKYGRSDEEAYQVVKQGAELKRDQESSLTANKGAVAGNTTTARVTGSLLAFIKTNTDKGATGADPVYTSTPTATRTDGTQRAFSETILKNVVQLGYTAGAKFKLVVLGPSEKQTASAFMGVATRYSPSDAGEMGAIIGGADVYISDFGKLTFVPDRFSRSRDALFLDPAMYVVMTLRPYHVQDVASTGDAVKRALVVEWGLKVRNEAGLGIAADLS